MKYDRMARVGGEVGQGNIQKNNDDEEVKIFGRQR